MPEPIAQSDNPEKVFPDKLTRINTAELMARVGGDRELLRDLCDIFAVELPGMLKTLEQAIDTGNAEAISRAAHGLKGAVGVFGKVPSFDAALMVETAARNNRLDETRSAFQSLLLNLEDLKAELKELARQ